MSKVLKVKKVYIVESDYCDFDVFNESEFKEYKKNGVNEGDSVYEVIKRFKAKTSTKLVEVALDENDEDEYSEDDDF